MNRESQNIHTQLTAISSAALFAQMERLSGSVKH